MKFVSLATLLPPIDPSSISEDVKRLIGPDFDYSKRRVLATRRLAREVDGLLEADAGLDFAGVEVVSPTFAHELLKRRAGLAVTNQNEDVRISWELARKDIDAHG